MYLSNYSRLCGANVEDLDGQDQNAVPLALANTRMTVSKTKIGERKNLFNSPNGSTYLTMLQFYRLFSVPIKAERI